MVVVAYAGTWWVATAIPGLMQWLVPPARDVVEGPIEGLEGLLLATCLLLWVLITWRAIGRPLPVVVAACMTLQVVVLLGEEVDWAHVVGLGSLDYPRNLRMWLRGFHIGAADTPIPDWVVPSLCLALFFIWPVVPVQRCQEWLRRAAPVCALPGDTLAVVVLLLVRLSIGVSLGVWASPEYLHLGVYLVLAIITVRIVRALRPARTDPASGVLSA